MTSDQKVQQLWKQHWTNQSTIDESGSFYGKFLHHKRLAIVQHIFNKLNLTSSILDMGCGSGETMTMFKQLGFENVTGIDFAMESMIRCEQRGFTHNKDVYLMDASHTTFKSNSFDIVFSEGLWEHFVDPRPHMTEACRLSKNYIIVIQPDHFSFFGFLMHLGWTIFSKNKGGVKEYSFPLSYFANFLKNYNFKLIESKSSLLHEQTVMVFKRQ